MDEVKFSESTGLPYYEDQNGEQWLLGALPPRPDSEVPACLGEFTAENVVIPRSMWRPVKRSHFQAPILNQSRTNSCVGHGTCTAFTRSRSADGLPFHRLSPFFVYGLINRDRDEGAYVSDALAAMMQIGICLESEVPHGMMFKRDFPKQAYETAKRFRIAKGYRLRTFDEIGSALQLGFDICFGIPIGKNFSRLDEGGVAPPPSDSDIVGGHAMAAMDLVKVQGGRFKDRWGIRIQNSWAEAFGHKGTAILVKEHFDRYCDAWAVQAAADDPQDPGFPTARE